MSDNEYLERMTWLTFWGCLMVAGACFWLAAWAMGS